MPRHQQQHGGCRRWSDLVGTGQHGCLAMTAPNSLQVKDREEGRWDRWESAGVLSCCCAGHEVLH